MYLEDNNYRDTRNPEHNNSSNPKADTNQEGETDHKKSNNPKRCRFRIFGHAAEWLLEGFLATMTDEWLWLL